jgi:hypothetical protein
MNSREAHPKRIVATKKESTPVNVLPISPKENAQTRDTNNR